MSWSHDLEHLDSSRNLENSAQLDARCDSWQSSLFLITNLIKCPSSQLLYVTFVFIYLLHVCKMV